MASAPKDKVLLMLVYGVMATASNYMRNPGERADRILPDLIGHVASTNTFDGNSVDQQVRNLRYLMDRLPIDQPVFVAGNSYVGAMEIISAVQHSDRIRLLVTYADPENAYAKGALTVRPRPVRHRKFWTSLQPAHLRNDFVTSIST